MATALTAPDAFERARAGLRRRLGSEALAAAVAPGRVNLIGEHTDYSGGFVMPMAIDRVCAVAAAPAQDRGVSRVFAVDVDEVRELDFSRPMLAAPTAEAARSMSNAVVRGSWVSYVAGVADEWRRMIERELPGLPPMPNVDLAISSDVPMGAGLSSSAALEVSVATALERVTGVMLPAVEKALVCQRAEHGFAGVPCGIMDQFISVMGRRGRAMLIDCRALRGEAVLLPEGAAVVVIDSRVPHELAAAEAEKSGGYAARRKSCEDAARILGVPMLRDASMADLDAARSKLGETVLRRARHVISENQRVLQGAALLRGGDLKGFGRLMRASHESLRDDYQVSSVLLDTLARAAWETAGVFGARLTGAGFGGCVVALCEPGAVPELEMRVKREYSASHGMECGVFVTCAGDGARPIDL